MVPYAPKIINLLIPHWQRAEDNPLFQSALVVTFTKITAVSIFMLYFLLFTCISMYVFFCYTAIMGH